VERNIWDLLVRICSTDRQTGVNTSTVIQ